ncbi:hypothetical protein CSIRO_2784 [Bradyrhizobiaceae bacterium SG-6C]|nr:hypothetical protein CSIRO_2784 [Bradyrhizobiaceae bacterium SG-6C]
MVRCGATVHLERGCRRAELHHHHINVLPDILATKLRHDFLAACRTARQRCGNRNQSDLVHVISPDPARIQPQPPVESNRKRKVRLPIGRLNATNRRQLIPASRSDLAGESPMTLEAAWASKRNRTTCGRGHPIPAYTGLGTVRRCTVCDTLQRARRAERDKYGPPRIKIPRPVASGPRTHCPSGHPYSGANLRIGYRGNNICRTCANAASERWKQEKKLDGKNPYRWKPKEETIKKIENAAAEGMLICQAKGLIRGAKPIVSPNTLLSIKQFFPERWKTIDIQFKLNRQTHSLIRVRRSVATSAPPARVFLSSSEAEELLQMVYRLLPNSLSRDHRDDAAHDLIAAVIEGAIDRSKITLQVVRQFVGKQYRENHNRWGDLSLDAAIGDDGFSLMDTIMDGAAWTVPADTGRHIKIR